MGTPSIAKTPPQLTAEQADALAQRQVKKHHVAIMLLHWFNAFVWLLELATGLALITSPYFRFTPQWYVDIVQGFFHSRADMLHFHIAVGVTWIIVFVVYGTFGFTTYLRKEVLQREIYLDHDDFRWLYVRLLRMLKRTTEALPPQGIYNAGQKLFALLVYAMIPVIMLTGLIMSLHLLSTTAVGWAVVLHFTAVGLVVSGLMVHVYMGAVFPEEKPAFFSMITGTVNELYAYTHHYKWWKEVAMERADFLREVAHEPAAVAPAPQVAPVLREGWLFRLFRRPEYWPPYAAGFGLGLTLLLTFIIMGQGLGASGGYTRWVAEILSRIAPGYATTNPYWSNYVQPGQSPLFDFLVFELIGVAVGGFVSGLLAGRLRIMTERGPRISAPTRWTLALAGGILTGIGARLARGCTSGLALSGGAVLSAGAFLFMFSVFAAGFAGAYFMRRYWL